MLRQYHFSLFVYAHASVADLLTLIFQRSIRSELKSMSIEEMQKLKEEIGLKLFNKAVKGDSGDGAKEEKRRRHFPRDNKVCEALCLRGNVCT